MHQLRARSGRSNTQISWADRVDFIGVVHICFTFVDIGMRGTIDNGIRFDFLYKA